MLPGSLSSELRFPVFVNTGFLKALPVLACCPLLPLLAAGIAPGALKPLPFFAGKVEMVGVFSAAESPALDLATFAPP